MKPDAKPETVAGGSGGQERPPRRRFGKPDACGDYPRPNEYRGGDDDPRLDAPLVEKIIDGAKSEYGKIVGGHGYGQTPAGKTNNEFPKRWGRDDIAAAFYEALEDGEREVTPDGTTHIQHRVDDVECVLRFNHSRRPVEYSVVFYPLRGGGTVKVTWRNGKRREKEL